PMTNADLTPEDLAALRSAVKHLKCINLLMQWANAIGKPIEVILEMMPKVSREFVDKVAKEAVEKCFDAALHTLGDKQQGDPWDRLHQALAAVSGAAGGFFGIWSLPVELPISTAIMLRSIAEIAQSEGEDLTDPEARLNCLLVLALGGASGKNSATDSAY